MVKLLERCPSKDERGRYAVVNMGEPLPGNSGSCYVPEARKANASCGARELLLACYLSGQINERQWQEHLRDDFFAAWVKRRLREAA